MCKVEDGYRVRLGASGVRQKGMWERWKGWSMMGEMEEEEEEKRKRRHLWRQGVLHSEAGVRFTNTLGAHEFVCEELRLHRKKSGRTHSHPC